MKDIQLNGTNGTIFDKKGILQILQFRTKKGLIRYEYKYNA